MDVNIKNVLVPNKISSGEKTINTYVKSCSEVVYDKKNIWWKKI